MDPELSFKIIYLREGLGLFTNDYNLVAIITHI